jgi:hypothetical protein
MTNPEITVARLAMRNLGVVTRSQALAEGLTQRQIEHALRRRLVRRLHDGVYLHSAVPLTREGRLLAATCAAGEGAVISHRSAARLHGLEGVPTWHIEVTVPRTALPHRQGIAVHRTNFLPDADWTKSGRIPVTTMARTLLDLGSVVPFEVVQQAVSDAVIRKFVSHAQLFSILERTGRRGRRGTAALRAVLEQALPDEKSESELERRLLSLAPRVAGLVLQHEVVTPRGRHYRLDMAVPHRMIAIEANGHRWHGSAKSMRTDMERRRDLASLGWTLYEYGWFDVVDAAATTRAELRGLLLPLAA